MHVEGISEVEVIDLALPASQTCQTPPPFPSSEVYRPAAAFYDGSPVSCGGDDTTKCHKFDRADNVWVEMVDQLENPRVGAASIMVKSHHFIY